MTILPPPIKPDPDLSSLKPISAQGRFEAGIGKAILLLVGILILTLTLLSQGCTSTPMTPKQCAQARADIERFSKDETEHEAFTLQLNERCK